PLKTSIDENAAAYSDYAALVEETKAYYEENIEKLQGPHGDLLESYLVNDEEPSEDLPHGTALYILANTKLSTSELSAEMDFLRQLLDNAIKYAGSIREITLMLKNPDLREGDTGWDFSYGKTTSGAEGHGVYVREAWSTSFDMYQTLTGLQDGIYKLTVNAAFRVATDNTNLNHASFIYANDNLVCTMMDAEDAIPVDAAVDGVNCHLSEGEGLVDNNIYNAENEVIAYTPHGPEGYGYAFSAGRYANTIVCEVSDGVLTVGVRSPGWGGTQGTWLADFHLYYCGEKDQALSAIASSLEGQVERARTILEQYVPLTNENYASSPNFSQALKDELQEAVNAASAATDVDKMLSLTATFSKLFEQIFACKQAYAKYIDALETFGDDIYKYGKGLTEDDFLNVSQLSDRIWEKYEAGAYSLEDALYMEDLKNSSYYPLIYGTEPEIVDGVVQLASPWEVLWMARRVAEGEKMNAAVVTAPIDFAGVPMIPIGTPASPYSGEFDGQFYPLTNLSTMLFGTISGAKLTRIAVESGTVTGNTDFASATGSIVGYTGLGWSSSARAARDRAVLVRRPMFTRIEPDGVREADGT
ncbi:MAG: hypothetical protein IJT48_09665, partial [Bacteroidaceae bacterium]|nr:hypothetical protein [Bacteroidaceae bacterium]